MHVHEQEHQMVKLLRIGLVERRDPLGIQRGMS